MPCTKFCGMLKIWLAMFIPSALFLATAPLPIANSGPIVTYSFSGTKNLTSPVGTETSAVKGDSDIFFETKYRDSLDVAINGKIKITLDWKNTPISERTRCFNFRYAVSTWKTGLLRDYLSIKSFADKAWVTPKPGQEALWNHQVVSKDTSDIQTFILPMSIKTGGTPRHYNEHYPPRSELAVAFQLNPVRAGSSGEKTMLSGTSEVYDADLNKLISPKPIADQIADSSLLTPIFPARGFRVQKEKTAEVDRPLLSLKKRKLPSIMPSKFSQRDLREYDNETLEALSQLAFGKDWRESHEIFSNSWITVSNYGSSSWYYPIVSIGPTLTIDSNQTIPSPTKYRLAKGIQTKQIREAGETLPHVESEISTAPDFPKRRFSGKMIQVQWYGGHTILHHEGVIEVRSESGQLLKQRKLSWRGNVLHPGHKGKDINFGPEVFTITVLGPDFDGGPFPWDSITP